MLALWPRVGCAEARHYRVSKVQEPLLGQREEMILTYKVKHNRDFSKELVLAKKVAEFAVKNKSRTSKDVKHFGLPSTISCQIIRKYVNNKNLKKIHSVKLTVSNQGARVVNSQLVITCLKLVVPFIHPVVKVKQVELCATYAYVSCEVIEKPTTNTQGVLGIDLNTTGHCAVVANSVTGKVFKLGKSSNHIHQKYKNIRKTLQRKRKYSKLKQVKNRESRIVRDTNHKISRKVVDEAIKQNCSINMENLKGIRKNKKQAKSFKYALNSWSFYQLRMFIEYKAKLAGIPVILIAPQYSSQRCSKCGLLGERMKKSFKCPHCGHVENADVNAAFNISIANTSDYIQSISQLQVDRDACKGSTDTPKEAMLLSEVTLEPQVL